MTNFNEHEYLQSSFVADSMNITNSVALENMNEHFDEKDNAISNVNNLRSHHNIHKINFNKFGQQPAVGGGGGSA